MVVSRAMVRHKSVASVREAQAAAKTRMRSLPRVLESRHDACI